MLAGTVGLASLLPLAACSKSIAESSDWASLEKVATEAITAKMTPGLSIAVMKDGTLIYSKGFGLANLETQTPVTTQTVFQIGSVTKQFIGAMILLLQQHGMLSVDDPVSKYYPDFPRSNEFTIRQLATHTSGLGNFTALKNRQILERSEYTSDAYMDDVLKVTDPLFKHEPGMQYAYSNTGYGLLGLIIEKVTDQAYNDVLEDYIFRPLNLRNTAVDSEFDVVLNRASGYSHRDDDSPGFIHAQFHSMTFPAAAGAIRSTAEDLCRWHFALLNHRLLTPEILDIMRSPITLANGEVSEYGFGLGLRERQEPFKGRETLVHGGGIYGFKSHLRTFPEEGITVACLFNTFDNNKEDFVPAFDAVKNQAALIAMGEQT